MKILHISNDFCLTKVHSLLYRELDGRGVEQTVFNPVRDAALVGRNRFEGEHTEIIYAHVVKPWHKYAYHLKRRHVYNEMLKRIRPQEYSLTHATTTDVNEFLKFMPHTWMAARRILLHAEKILFIGKSLYHSTMTHKAIQGISSLIENRCVFIPNGINYYYLDHVRYATRKGHNIVFVGRFDSNKNVVRLAKAVMQLREQPQFTDCTLTLVGGGRADTNEMERMIADHPDVFRYVPPITEPAKMAEQFEHASVFAMPSLHETFGLVYIEALSQGLPVLYTKGLAKGLAALLTDDSAGNQDVDFEQFRWSKIAEKYMMLYNDLDAKH